MYHRLIKEMIMKRLWIFGMLLFGLSACGTVAGSEAEGDIPESPPVSESERPEPAAISVSLPDLGIAPELTNEVWINVDEPLRLANLRGNVVAIEMWTYS